MVEPGGDLDLGEEPLDTEHGAELGAQDLERDLAVVLEVGGEEDGRHAAGAELAFDAVALLERGGEATEVAHPGLGGTAGCLGIRDGGNIADAGRGGQFGSTALWVCWRSVRGGGDPSGRHR